MLVPRSLSWQTTLNWTNRTSSLPDNCPQTRPHTTTFRLSSLHHYPDISQIQFKRPASPAGNKRQPHRNHHYQPSVNAQFPNTVIQKLAFLMNEIRTKKNFSSILINCSPFTNNKNHHQQHHHRHHHRHRCHQASKSNKVFLRYTPRDPRLRFNKHSSELSEDLCNYGELIGGDSASIFSVPSSRSQSSIKSQQKSLRYVKTILAKDSSSIYGEYSKDNCTQLLTSVLLN